MKLKYHEVQTKVKVGMGVLFDDEVPSSVVAVSAEYCTIGRKRMTWRKVMRLIRNEEIHFYEEGVEVMFGE